MLYLKCILIGITMMIPGLSGGSCAILLNCYDTLLSCIANIKENLKQNIITCIIAGLGIISGILIFSFFLYNITTLSYFPSIVFGIILANILLMKRKINTFKFKYIITTIIGILILFIFKYTNFSFNFSTNIFYLFILGLILAIGLILPGLGATYILYLMDAYEYLNTSIKTLNVPFLLTLSIFTLIGILLSTKKIDKILKKEPYLLYSLVIGFLIGSLDYSILISIKKIITILLTTTSVYLIFKD